MNHRQRLERMLERRNRGSAGVSWHDADAIEAAMNIIDELELALQGQGSWQLMTRALQEFGGKELSLEARRRGSSATGTEG